MEARGLPQVSRALAWGVRHLLVASCLLAGCLPGNPDVVSYEAVELSRTAERIEQGSVTFPRYEGVAAETGDKGVHYGGMFQRLSLNPQASVAQRCGGKTRQVFPDTGRIENSRSYPAIIAVANRRFDVCRTETDGCEGALTGGDCRDYTFADVGKVSVDGVPVRFSVHWQYGLPPRREYSVLADIADSP